jgi:hypothetical protein
MSGGRGTEIGIALETGVVIDIRRARRRLRRG